MTPKIALKKAPRRPAEAPDGGCHAAAQRCPSEARYGPRRGQSAPTAALELPDFYVATATPTGSELARSTSSGKVIGSATANFTKEALSHRSQLLTLNRELGDLLKTLSKLKT